MGRRLSDDVLRWTLDVNGKPAIKELGQVEQETRGLEKTNKDLNMELRKLEAAGKKNSTVYKNLRGQISENNKTILANKQRMAELRKEIGLGGLTARQLRSEYQRLKNQIDNTTPNTPQWRRLNQELQAVQQQQQRVNSGFQRTNQLFGQLRSLIPALGIGALVMQMRRLFQNSIRVRKEFEKYEATLKVLLGSQLEAAEQMAQLQEFAKTTPFDLIGLTEAYVMLVNQGFKPTMEEMTRLGDLAASQGRDFGALANAISSAYVGQFMALRSFGIMAQKDGEMIRFTFRGMTEEVDFNREAINKYILGLGELKGIKGDMAAVALTLGGRISNLGDAWDKLMNLMGARTSGVVGRTIGLFSHLIDYISRMIEKPMERQQDALANINNEIQRELEIVARANYTQEQRARHIQQINQQYGKYLPNLLDEKASLEEIARFTRQVNNEMMARILLLDYEEELASAIRRRKEATEGLFLVERERTRQMIESGQMSATELEAMQKRLDIAESINQSIIESTEEMLDNIDQKYEFMAEKFGMTMQQIRESFRDATAVDDEIEGDFDQALKGLEKYNEKKKLAVMQQRAQGKISEEAYQMELLMLEFAYLEARKQAYIRFGEDITRINQDIATAQIRLINQMEQAQKATIDAIISSSDQQIEEIIKIQDREFDEFIAREESRRRIDVQMLRERFEAFRQDAENRRAIMDDLASSMGDLMGRVMMEAEFDMRNFQQSLITIALDTLHKIVRMVIAEIWARSLASAESLTTWGVAGVAKATALSALVEGAFAAAKSAVRTSQAASGRYDVLGADDNRMYRGVSYTGSVKRSGIPAGGRPTLINEHGGEAILTAPHVRNLQLNYPALLNALMATRVPQRAAGSYGAIDPSRQDQGEDDETKMVLSMLRDAVNGLTDRLRDPIEADLSYTRFERQKKIIDQTRSRVAKRG